MIGQRIGPYDIAGKLGEGGMGEVYRARDTKLNRDVALKVLPDLVANDAERLARFHREAQVLASLNHPNIAAIYGFEDSGGTHALVMELVEGPTLADRVARGPIPLDEALPIAKQIADALEAAHEQGIIHRDLKPANVKVRDDGTVKVLDFGLAKAMDAGAGAAGRPGGENFTQSPTITTPAMTQAGMILGTAAYMAPEQARGRSAERRADVWAFGVVLFEMLAGRRVFAGETISDTLASVLKTDPDWQALPVDTPAALQRLLRRCLEKDPRRRLQAIGEARVQIEDLLSGAPNAAGVPATPRAWSFGQRALPWVITGAFAMGLAIVIVLWAPWRIASPPAPLRLSAELGADISLRFGAGDLMSLSPDGAVLAFVAPKGAGGSLQLYVRRLAQLQATALPGTDGADSPAFSPNGQWIAFLADGKLKKIAATGGAAVTVCEAANARGIEWLGDDTIIFANTIPGSGLMRVSSASGLPETLISAVQGEIAQRWPQALPGGQSVLFTSSGSIGSYNNADLVVQTLASGARTVVQRGGFHARYLPSGHLVYLHDGTLFAVPFDTSRLAVTGPPVPALDGVASNPVTGGAQVAVSANGTLAYVPGQSGTNRTPIHWMDHAGKTTPLRATPSNWFGLAFAPDGRRLAVQIAEGQNDIWVYEWARDALTRLTSDPASDQKPVWTPDGRRIVFASTRGDKSTLNLYWQPADGTGDAQRLTESQRPQQPASWHPSGKFLAFEEVNAAANSDLMTLPMEGDEASGWKPGKPMAFLATPFQEHEPMFSPDGHWLAYSSDKTGRDEVYVRPFPGPNGEFQISNDGGHIPTWSRAKRELFYVRNGQIMAASYAVEGDVFRAEKPQPWGEPRLATRGEFRMFDLHPDGARVAFAPTLDDPALSGPKQDHVTFIFNFFDELRRIAPVTKR
jgi:serine/threonine-protein kinase